MGIFLIGFLGEATSGDVERDFKYNQFCTYLTENCPLVVIGFEKQQIIR